MLIPEPTAMHPIAQIRICNGPTCGAYQVFLRVVGIVKEGGGRVEHIVRATHDVVKTSRAQEVSLPQLQLACKCRVIRSDLQLHVSGQTTKPLPKWAWLV